MSLCFGWWSAEVWEDIANEDVTIRLAADPPSPAEVFDGWLKRENLKGFLIVLSDMIGYGFDDLDWGAFEAGLDDDAIGGWFTYPLVGCCALEVAISQDLDADLVDLRVSIPPGAARLMGKIEVAVKIFNHCDVSPDVDYIPAEP